MLDMIRKQFLIQKDDLIASALVAAGAGIFGVLLLQVIYYLKPDAAAEDVYKRQVLLPVAVLSMGMWKILFCLRTYL